MKSEDITKWEYCIITFSFLCLVLFIAFVAYLVSQSQNHDCKENIKVERPLGLSIPFNDRLFVTILEHVIAILILSMDVIERF